LNRRPQLAGREDMTMPKPAPSEAEKLRRKLNAAHASRDWHKNRAKALADQVRELKDARRAGYEEGARATMLSTYLAIADYGLPGIEWLTERHRAVAKKQPPPNTAVDEAVTLSVIEHMRGYDPKRAEQIEKEFADFLVGDSTK
jgi:hypothetical protein